MTARTRAVLLLTALILGALLFSCHPRALYEAQLVASETDDRPQDAPR